MLDPGGPPGHPLNQTAMVHYYIFKTDYPTDKTTHICNGSHDSEEECGKHFRAYSYGFMDAMNEAFGHGKYSMQDGNTDLSFIFSSDNGKTASEYFMLFDQRGQDLIKEIS